MFQNTLEDVIAIEEEASTNNDKLQCVFCKKYFENQPEKNLHLALWHYEKQNDLAIKKYDKQFLQVLWQNL